MKKKKKKKRTPIPFDASAKTPVLHVAAAQPGHMLWGTDQMIKEKGARALQTNTDESPPPPPPSHTGTHTPTHIHGTRTNTNLRAASTSPGSASSSSAEVGNPKNRHRGKNSSSALGREAAAVVPLFPSVDHAMFPTPATADRLSFLAAVPGKIPPGGGRPAACSGFSRADGEDGSMQT